MKCTYRNCKNELINKRKDAKFCCRKCKVYERTYIKRQEEFINRSFLYNKGIIEFIKELNPTISTKNQILLNELKNKYPDLKIDKPIYPNDYFNHLKY